MQRFPPPSPGPGLLITGAPRSGTTLLGAIMGGHPELCVINEDKSAAWRRVLGRKWACVKLCIPNQIEESRVRGRQAAKRLRARIADELASYRPWDLGETELRSERSAAVGIDALLAHEQLRVLGIVRAPEQVIASIQRRGCQPLSEALYRWLRAVEILDRLRAEHPTRVRIVAFPALLAEPERQASACCRWLGLTYRDNMICGFTPAYRRTGFDASRANPQDPALQAQLERDFPDQWAAFLRLLAESNADTESTGTQGEA